jgi:aryl-alcohol dehydrogenase-like predicted oxidoreductase
LTKQEYTGEDAAFIDEWVGTTLLDIANDEGVSLTQLAIGWVIAQRQVACAVVGATNAAQARQNMSAHPLPPAVLEKIDGAVEALERQVGRPLAEFRGLAG